MLTADAPLDPPSIIVPSPKDGSPQILVGIVAYGNEIDATKLEAAAKAANLHAGRPRSDNRSVEVMILFDATTPAQVAFDFMNQVNRGDFGTFRVATMLVPPSGVKKTK